ncbi:MAG: hypothetical protein JWL76_2004 [Thermoleophilia bacterium]|nr:hypothetical protein [Thermoleophilia bacterium]
MRSPLPCLIGLHRMSSWQRRYSVWDENPERFRYCTRVGCDHKETTDA